MQNICTVTLKEQTGRYVYNGAISKSGRIFIKVATAPSETIKTQIVRYIYIGAISKSEPILPIFNRIRL